MISLVQRNIVEAGVTANASSKIAVAQTPDQYVIPASGMGLNWPEAT